MPQGRRTRILIVDDSAVMRTLLRSVINSDPGLEMVGSAVNGESALDMMESLRPDLVLLDVEMPVMDGVQTLRELRARNIRIPVIMCSSLTQRGAAVTIEALSAGASDYVAKPCGQSNLTGATQALSQDLLPKIHALAGKRQPQPTRQAVTTPAALAPIQLCSSMPPAVVAIGVSTGGPAALDVVLPQLPASFPLPVLIVQHMPEVFTQMLAERLGRTCPLRILEAFEGSPVSAGTVYIARGNWHMEVRAAGIPGHPHTLHLTQAAPENHCRPAVDVMFRTATAVFGGGVLGVVLTGMGSDGLAGARLIHARGGTVLVQDEVTSAVWGMPGAVARAGLAQRVLPLHSVAAEILRLAGRAESEARALPETMVS